MQRTNITACTDRLSSPTVRREALSRGRPIGLQAFPQDLLDWLSCHRPASPLTQSFPPLVAFIILCQVSYIIEHVVQLPTQLSCQSETLRWHSSAKMPLLYLHNQDATAVLQFSICHTLHYSFFVVVEFLRRKKKKGEPWGLASGYRSPYTLLHTTHTGEKSMCCNGCPASRSCECLGSSFEYEVVPVAPSSFLAFYFRRENGGKTSGVILRNTGAHPS
ncbi:hypothetical protein EV401DRAFT_1038534 [Pisolithus croceorrhizus]|nr:hypothetical protein EV401DRAFT_1038534 [Pisolithus croceorrhizus]